MSTDMDAATVALSALPAMGPARLRALLGRWEPDEAWRRVAAGGVADDPVLHAVLGRTPRRVAATWASAAGGIVPDELVARHRALGVRFARAGDEPFPADLAADVEPPAVLFWLGDLDALERRPRAAVVGTRACTATGSAVAREIGAGLATAGVAVTSGLAKGIDGAAHRGALQYADVAPAVGVVASGLDVVYPASNRALWDDVARCGVLLSEAPLGTPPERWRFPARNRIIAALADVVVVVESRAAGGSMHTVDEALRRDVPVMAVPGSVRHPASAGTNRLLHEGCAPARDALDVLVSLGCTPAPRASRAATVIWQHPGARAVLDAVGGEPSTLDQLALRCGLGLGELTVALAELLERGAVVDDHGWYSRVG